MGREDSGTLEEAVGVVGRVCVVNGIVIVNILVGVVHGNMEMGSEREAVRGRWARVGGMGRRWARDGSSSSER